MTSANLCIIVLGPPATGKTHLATKLSERFAIPLLSKDEFKEQLMEGLGEPIDRKKSQLVGGLSFDLLYLTAKKLAATGSGFVIEADFTRPDLASAQLGPLLKGHGYRVIMINLHGDCEVLAKRFRQRFEQGKRHPGHCDREFLSDANPERLFARREFLAIEGEKVAVDTTDLDQVDFSALLERLV